MKNKIGLTITSLLLITLPAVAKAVGFMELDITEFVFEGLLKLINILVNFVGGMLITLAGSLVNYVYSFPDFVKAPVVQVGWTITRDLANMTFILGMLAIAFATILRMDILGFNLRKTLPKLIAMALLLNFSLVISGAIIDVGNSLGRFFVSGAKPGEEINVGANIMAAVSAGQIAQMRNRASANMTTNLLMSSIIQLIFYVILAFLLFAMAFIMVYRIVHLWLLIIMAPLAWVCSFLPSMSNYYTKWWSSFLQWAFIPAAMGFFIFLGLITGATFMGSDFTRTRDVGSAWENILPETPIAAIMQFIVVVFILFMGLATAQRWGLSGANTMMKVAQDSKKWATGKVWGGVKSLSVKTAGRLAQKALYKEGEGGKRTDLREGLQNLAGAGYGVGKVFGKAMRIPTSLIEQRQKLIKGSEDKLKGSSTETLKTIFAGLSDYDKAAATRLMADRGNLEFITKDDLLAKRLGKKSNKELTDEEKKLELNDAEKDKVGMINEDKMGGMTQARFEAALKFSGTAGLDKEILNAAPQFAKIVGKEIKDIIEKMSPANADKIQRGALQLPEIQAAIKEAVLGNHWGIGQLSAIGRKNPKAESDLLEYLKTNIESKESLIAKRLGKSVDELNEADRKLNLTDEEKTKDQASKINKKTWVHIIGTPGGATFEEEEKETAPEQSNLVDQFNRPINQQPKPSGLVDASGNPLKSQ